MKVEVKVLCDPKLKKMLLSWSRAVSSKKVAG